MAQSFSYYVHESWWNGQFTVAIHRGDCIYSTTVDSTTVTALVRTLCQVGVEVSDSAVTQIKLRWVIHGLYRRH
jgi:hypothetical protein